MRRIWRIPLAAPFVLLALSGPVFAFQEMPEPPLEEGTPALQASPSNKQVAVHLQNQGPAAESWPQQGFNFEILPRLDLGLELLYGDGQRGGSQDPIADETGDVTVLGKVKQRF